MLLVLCSRIQWLVAVSTVFFSSRLTQAHSVSFPGKISHYPLIHYVMEGRDFNTTCVVTLNRDGVKADISFILDSTRLSNSSNTTIISTRDGDRVIGTLVIRNAVLSNTQRLTCIASSVVSREFTSINQASVIHSYKVPFVIAVFPPEKLHLDPTNSYTLRCVVTVDKNFPLTAVNVSVLYYSISPNVNIGPTNHYQGAKTSEETRTIIVSVLIDDVAQKSGGTYICDAETKAIENAVIHPYSRSKITKILTSNSQSPQNSTEDNSTDKNNDWLILLFVFVVITVVLLIVFTLLVFAVIWTKKHRSRNYPVSPFPGTIPTTAPGAKSNYYLDSPVSAVNNVALQQPAMALHITPRLQSISSAETDV